MMRREKFIFSTKDKRASQHVLNGLFIFLKKVADFFCLKNIQSIMLGLKEPFLR